MPVAVRPALAPAPRPVPLSLKVAAVNGFKFKAGTVIFVGAVTFYCYLGMPLSWREAGFWLSRPVSASGRLLAIEPTRWALSTKPGGGAIGTGAAVVHRWRYRFTD